AAACSKGGDDKQKAKNQDAVPASQDERDAGTATTQPAATSAPEQQPGGGDGPCGGGGWKGGGGGGFSGPGAAGGAPGEEQGEDADPFGGGGFGGGGFGLSDTAPNYQDDIKAILDASCTSCHGPGDKKPDLSTYENAAKRGKRSAMDIASGKMPPPSSPPLD